jgi:hypothetical protein
LAFKNQEGIVMRNTSQLFKQAGIALALSFSSSVAFAGTIANEQLDAGGLTLSPTVSYDTASLRVSSDALDTTSIFNAGDSIRVDSGGLADGVYSYELSLNTDATEAAPKGSNATQMGDFIVHNGAATETDAGQNATAQAEKEAAEAVAVANAMSVSKPDER